MRNWTKMPLVCTKVRFRLEKRRSATEPEPVEFAFQFYTHDLYISAKNLRTVFTRSGLF